MEPGNYVVIPSLFKKERETKFILRIHMPENLFDSIALPDFQTRSSSINSDSDIQVRSRSLYKINPIAVAKPKNQKNLKIINEQQDILKEIDTMMGVRVKSKVKKDNIYKTLEHDDLLNEIDNMIDLGKAFKKTIMLNQKKKTK